jgi:hypothetical protein
MDHDAARRTDALGDEQRHISYPAANVQDAPFPDTIPAS